jgi:hypothetical protein
VKRHCRCNKQKYQRAELVCCAGRSSIHSPADYCCWLMPCRLPDLR